MISIRGFVMSLGRLRQIAVAVLSLLLSSGIGIVSRPAAKAAGDRQIAEGILVVPDVRALEPSGDDAEDDDDDADEGEDDDDGGGQADPDVIERGEAVLGAPVVIPESRPESRQEEIERPGGRQLEAERGGEPEENLEMPDGPGQKY